LPTTLVAAQQRSKLINMVTLLALLRNIALDVVSITSGGYGPVKGRRAMLITAAFVTLWVSVNMGLFFVLWFFAEGAAKLRVLNRVGERRSRCREAPKL
jgi:hypothetical protein